MPTNDLPRMLFDAVNQHIPPGAGWVPITAAAVLGLLGLVFMVKGARLAPVLAAIVFAMLGGFAASLLPGSIGGPLWLMVAAGSVVGLVLGVVLFKVWLAALVGACLIVGSLGLYSGHVLRDPLNAYLAAGLDREQQLVTLPEAGDAVVEAAPWKAEIAGLWSYLGENVPNFQASFLAIVISTGLAGLIFGLLLPKLARAFWAASLGTGLLLLTAYGVAHVHWPAGGQWLSQWGVLVGAVLWGVSMVYNLADIQGIRLKKNPDAESKKAAA